MTDRHPREMAIPVLVKYLVGNLQYLAPPHGPGADGMALTPTELVLHLLDGLEHEGLAIAHADRSAAAGLHLGTSAAEAVAALAENAPKPHASGESFTVARRRADAEAQPGTLLGHQVGDGLDQERADARAAIDLLRSFMREVVVIDDGAGRGWAHARGYLSVSGDVQLTTAQADLIARLAAEADGPALPASHAARMAAPVVTVDGAARLPPGRHLVWVDVDPPKWES